MAGSFFNFILAILLAPYLFRSAKRGKLTLETFDPMMNLGRRIIGPIAIFRIAAASGRQGVPAMTALIMRFCIGIGVLQLIPVPFLDGGHALAALFLGFYEFGRGGSFFILVSIALISIIVFYSYLLAIYKLAQVGRYLEYTRSRRFISRVLRQLGF